MAEVVVSKSGLDKVEIFGKVDRNKEGHIGSEYPAYYFKPQQEELRENIRRIEHGLQEGLIPERGKTAAMTELRQHKDRLESIESSRPKLDSAMIDELAKASNYLGEKISEMTPSRSDEMKGLVDPHDIVERMHTPTVKVDDRTAILAKKMGIRISNDGKITGNDANRIWKITRSLQGESTNTEALRRA